MTPRAHADTAAESFNALPSGTPVLYGALGYVSVALGCAAYNLVARYSGGIEVEVAPGATTARE